MNHEPPVARIDYGLKAIIPAFFQNLRDDMERIRAAMAARAPSEAGRVAHGLKGACLGFGFAHAAELARRLETAIAGSHVLTAPPGNGRAENGGGAALSSDAPWQIALRDLAHHVDTVRVEYVDTGQF
ncbi:MAG: Hpt domain-containing protein [Desulfovibrionaceae bacterium]|nr:Hpt domain-containing protein [Desulfovibrionaceae bacterium]